MPHEEWLVEFDKARGERDHCARVIALYVVDGVTVNPVSVDAYRVAVRRVDELHDALDARLRPA